MSLLKGLMPPSLGNVTFINNLLQGVGFLIALVPELLQNGGSPLGLLPVPVLPPYLHGPGYNDQNLPWGNRTANGTNYYVDVPNTGVTRYYDFTIERGIVAPDGVEKLAILINGQFPGPTIEANWGDYVQVTVTNKIKGPEEGTSLHWHGLTLKTTPYFDGVPGVDMCPITPGDSYTYKFQADLYGSSWYHSHYSAQYAGGIYGAMVIHGPTSAPYDIDIGPVLLADYYHLDYFSYVQQGSSPSPATAQLVSAENTLIQGKMAYDCSMAPKGSKCHDGAGLAKFNFTSGKTHRLRLINPSAAAYMVVSIDDHDMTVIANDFVPVVPYTVKQVYLHVGQRLDVLVKGTGKPGKAYWFRIRQPVLCAIAIQPFALAAIYYENANTNLKPLTLPHTEFIEPTLINCANDPLGYTEPYYAIPAEVPDNIVKIDITQKVNETGNTLYLMNGQSFRADYNHPTLGYAYAGNTTYAAQHPEWNVYDFGNNKTTRIVFQNNVPFAHPMHLHGQNMMVLDEGVGAWDGETVIRPANPQRRDTVILQPNGYLVVQLTSDNPGVWPFHCHIAWHVSLGLYINVVQRPNDIAKLHPETMNIIEPNCAKWRAYTVNNPPNQIDSGVKLLLDKN